MRMRMNTISKTPRRPKAGLCLILAAALLTASVAGAADLAPIPLKLPRPAFKGTPEDPPEGTTVEKPTGKPRPAFLAPPGATNVALNKKAVCSDKNPMNGTVDLVTDGDKEATDEAVLVMRKGTQYAQVDLGAAHTIYAVVFWHNHDAPRVYRDVVVQVADDPDFIENVRTLYNNDQDNSSGLGIGTDREYFETNEGKLIDAKGVKARYVRIYSKGSTYASFNEVGEIEVYGLPAK
jgi:hypothetical protein